MNWKRVAIAGLVAGGLLVAQPGGRGPRGPRGPRPDTAALKEALNLSDAQVQQIRDMTRQQMEGLKPLGDEMRDKSQALREEMKKDSPDQAKVGQLTVDLKTLRDQLKSKRTTRADGISALLTPEQRTKLKSLEEAARLAPAARQAAALGLIEPPPPPEPEQRLGAAMRTRAERGERGARKQ